MLNIHVIRTMPYSCLNRDDTNQPKTTELGGVRRTRVSSQCMKRNIRTTVNRLHSDLVGGIRSRAFVDIIAQNAEKEGVKAETAKLLATNAVSALLESDVTKDKEDKKNKSKNKKAKAQEDTQIDTQTKMGDDGKPEGKTDDKLSGERLMFLSSRDVEKIIDLIKNQPEKLKDVETAKKYVGACASNISWDIAAFGRMTSSKVYEDVEASISVAHSFSANESNEETDFFTAVDDYREKEELGAGHMGVNTYTSPILYTYACIDVAHFKHNLSAPEDEKEKIIKTVVAEIIRTIAGVSPTPEVVIDEKTGKPSGNARIAKSASTAPFQPAVMVLVEDSPLPLSYANAFITPVVTENEAVEAFAKHVENLDNAYAIETKRWWFNTINKPLGETKPVNFAQILAGLETAISGKTEKAK